MIKFCVIENHPADSRVTLSEEDVCQTLTGRMGTGGGNVPMILTIKDDDEEDNTNGKEIL